MRTKLRSPRTLLALALVVIAVTRRRGAGMIKPGTRANVWPAGL